MGNYGYYLVMALGIWGIFWVLVDIRGILKEIRDKK
jgi:hypothetical protein